MSLRDRVKKLMEGERQNFLLNQMDGTVSDLIAHTLIDKASKGDMEAIKLLDMIEDAKELLGIVEEEKKPNWLTKEPPQIQGKPGRPRKET